MSHWLDMVVTLLEAETSDLEELCEIAGGDPRTFYRGVDFSEIDLSAEERDFLERSAALDVIAKINGAGRQEERVAILLAQILEDPISGISALMQYNEMSKYARRMIGLARESFSLRDMEEKNREFIVARLIPSMYTEIFPYNRGVLMFYLAKHLGKYPIVRSAIRQSMKRSRSIYMERVRPEVENFFGAAESSDAQPIPRI